MEFITTEFSGELRKHVVSNDIKKPIYGTIKAAVWLAFY